MDDMPVVWTERRPLALPMIAGMAPDYGTWRAADTLARSGQDSRVGRVAGSDAVLLWAEFPDGHRPPARPSVLLPHLVVACTCASSAFPCRHALALLLLDHAVPPSDAPSSDDAPAWLAARLEAGLRAARAGATPAGDTARQEVMAAGLQEMARRLRDEVGRGLAGLPHDHRRPWLDAADRLDDAYAPAAARELRALAALPGAPQWPEQLLPRLGRLMLLAEAFGRLDELPPGERGDALTAAGWPPRPDDAAVAGVWLALGRRQTLDGGRRGRRTWLRGLSTGRWALLEEFRPAKRLEGRCFPAGTRLAGQLAFLPSAWPLAAQPVDGLRLVADDGGGEAAGTALGPTGGHDIAAAVAEYATARAANPWLALFPMLLSEVLVEPAPAGWRLRDRRGRLLPLPARFGHGWQLLALAGDRPLTLFGEWDGATLTPLSAHTAAGWRDLPAWKGLS